VDGPDATDLEGAIDRLYQQPLAAFVEARNALAATLKVRGDREGAERVRSLAKPSVPAWAVNQAFWTARAELDRAIEAGRRLHALQHVAGPSAGNELRAAVRERREALATVLKKAEASLSGAGHAATPAVMQRVSATLEALSAEPAGAATLGRLDKEREPPGFDAFRVLPPLAVTGFPDLTGGHEPPDASEASAGPADTPPAAETRALVARALAEVAARKRAVEAATVEATAARTRLEAARTSAEEAQRRLGDAEQRAHDAEQALARAADALARAEQAVAADAS